MEEFEPIIHRNPESKVLQPAEILDGKGAKDLFDSAHSFVLGSGDEVIAGTDKGINGGKNVNEDRLLVMPKESLIAVIDGIGGAADGDIAAQMLAEEIKTSSNDIPLAVLRTKSRMKNEGFGENSGSCFVRAKILEENGKKKLEIWQQGDCSILIFDKKGNLKWKSEDDVLVKELIKAGQMTEDQALYRSNRNIVTSAVTVNSNGEPKTYELSKTKLEPGDRVFIMSDGISDNLTPKEIWQATEEMDIKDAMSAISFITGDRSYNRKKIIEATGGYSGREEKGTYADGFKPEPKPDNRALAILEIK